MSQCRTTRSQTSSSMSPPMDPIPKRFSAAARQISGSPELPSLSSDGSDWGEDHGEDCASACQPEGGENAGGGRNSTSNGCSGTHSTEDANRATETAQSEKCSSYDWNDESGCQPFEDFDFGSQALQIDKQTNRELAKDHELIEAYKKELAGDENTTWRSTVTGKGRKLLDARSSWLGVNEFAVVGGRATSAHDYFVALIEHFPPRRWFDVSGVVATLRDTQPQVQVSVSGPYRQVRNRLKDVIREGDRARWEVGAVIRSPLPSPDTLEAVRIYGDATHGFGVFPEEISKMLLYSGLQWLTHEGDEHVPPFWRESMARSGSIGSWRGGAGAGPVGGDGGNGDGGGEMRARGRVKARGSWRRKLPPTGSAPTTTTTTTHRREAGIGGMRLGSGAGTEREGVGSGHVTGRQEDTAMTTPACDDDDDNHSINRCPKSTTRTQIGPAAIDFQPSDFLLPSSSATDKDDGDDKYSNPRPPHHQYHQKQQQQSTLKSHVPVNSNNDNLVHGLIAVANQVKSLRGQLRALAADVGAELAQLRGDIDSDADANPAVSAAAAAGPLRQMATASGSNHTVGRAGYEGEDDENNNGGGGDRDDAGWNGDPGRGHLISWRQQQKRRQAVQGKRAFGSQGEEKRSPAEYLSSYSSSSSASALTSSKRHKRQLQVSHERRKKRSKRDQGKKIQRMQMTAREAPHHVTLVNKRSFRDLMM